MDETVDTSVWMRHGDPVITHERLAKGGMICNEGIYQLEHPHIIDWLLDERIIEPHHHSAGHKIIEAKIIMGNMIGTEKNRQTIVVSTTATPICAATLYNKVMRDMMKISHLQAIVSRILFEPSGENDKIWMRQYKSLIQDSFEKLAKLLDEHRDNMVSSVTSRLDSCAQNLG